MFGALFFWLCATIAFFFGIGVVVARNPMHSALSLVATLTATAGLFLLLQAEFIAWILIVVYTGAVMVLMIFVISLLNLQKDDPIDWNPARRWGVGMVVLFALVFLVYLFRDPLAGFFSIPQAPPTPPEWGSITVVALDLFTRYLLPFELASVLLTAAVIGAVAIARPESPERETKER